MNDQELREMIRASIARHSRTLSAETAEHAEEDRFRSAGSASSAFSGHASFARLPLLRSGDDDGACLIEPSVRCNHCGYCLSYGH